jgi:hypothetical protein
MTALGGLFQPFQRRIDILFQPQPGREHDSHQVLGVGVACGERGMAGERHRLGRCQRAGLVEAHIALEVAH